MLIMKSGIRVTTEGIEQPNQERIRTLQVFGNIGSGHNQTSRDEILKNYQKNEKTPKKASQQKFCQIDKHQGSPNCKVLGPRGARGVRIIVVGKRHGDTSSNRGRD